MPDTHVASFCVFVFRRCSLKNREGDAGVLFESAMTRAVTAFKMSWKRCIDVDKVSETMPDLAHNRPRCCVVQTKVLPYRCPRS